MIRLIHSSQGLRWCCSCWDNAWRWTPHSSADSHILPLRQCYILDVALALSMFSFRCCHTLQYSFCFGYITCHCTCFAIIVFYKTEIYSLIFTLSSSIPEVLNILRWSIIGLRCSFLLIRIRIVAILPLIPVDVTCSPLKPTMCAVLHILCWCIICLWCFLLLMRISIVAILTLTLFDITGSEVKPLEFSCGMS